MPKPSKRIASLARLLHPTLKQRPAFRKFSFARDAPRKRVNCSTTSRATIRKSAPRLTHFGEASPSAPHNRTNKNPGLVYERRFAARSTLESFPLAVDSCCCWLRCGRAVRVASKSAPRRAINSLRCHPNTGACCHHFAFESRTDAFAAASLRLRILHDSAGNCREQSRSIRQEPAQTRPRDGQTFQSGSPRRRRAFFRGGGECPVGRNRRRAQSTFAERRQPRPAAVGGASSNLAAHSGNMGRRPRSPHLACAKTPRLRRCGAQRASSGNDLRRRHGPGLLHSHTAE